MKKIHTLIFAALLSSSMFATVFTITVSTEGYSPNAVTVHENDTVRFSWISGSHPVISETLSWSAFSVNAANPTKDIILTEAGSYPFHCYLHGGVEGAPEAEQGIITVEGDPVIECSVPTNVSVSVTATAASLAWDAMPDAIKYNVQYRVLGSTLWTTKKSFTNSKSIGPLASGTTYQYRVKTFCSSTPVASKYTATKTFTTETMRTGIEENAMTITPNPNDGNFTLQLSGFAGKTVISVFDMDGKELYTNDLIVETNSYALDLNLQNAATSFFIVRIHDATHMMTKKVLIQ